MESNRDEALKCLAIAQRHRDGGNLASARKFAQKSINLFSTPEGTKLLASIDELANANDAGPSKSDAGSSSTFTSSAEAHPSASGAKHRHTHKEANGTASGSGGDKRDFTPDQAAIVKRVRTCRVTEYYEILALKKDCEDNDVKKAYRKVCE